MRGKMMVFQGNGTKVTYIWLPVPRGRGWDASPPRSLTIDPPPSFLSVGTDAQRTSTTTRRVDGRSRNSQR